MGQPPLDPILQAQLALPLDSKDLAVPHFAALYKHLVSDHLDEADLSTIAQNKQYEAQGTERDLQARCIDMVKDALLARALREICVFPIAPSSTSASNLSSHPSSASLVKGSPPSLDQELRELSYFMSEYVTAGLTGRLNHTKTAATVAAANGYQSAYELQQLLTPSIQRFEENLPAIASVLNTHISGLETTLADLASLIPLSSASTTTSTSTLSFQPTTPSFPTMSLSSQSSQSSTTTLTTALSSLTTLQTHTLPTLLNTLTSTLHSLLAAQTTLLSSSIHALETHTFSTLSRNLTTHASFLATVARGIALKTRILTLLDEKTIYAEEGVREALRARWDELVSESNELTEREGMLKTLVGEYVGVMVGRDGEDGQDQSEGGQRGGGISGGDGENVMRTLGREYIQIEKEISEVKEDIRRLEQEQEQRQNANAGRRRGR